MIDFKTPCQISIFGEENEPTFTEYERKLYNYVRYQIGYLGVIVMSNVLKFYQEQEMWEECKAIHRAIVNYCTKKGIEVPPLDDYTSYQDVILKWQNDVKINLSTDHIENRTDYCIGRIYDKFIAPKQTT